MTPLMLILLALAVYRVSHMITREDGPFDLFSTWRDYVGQANWIGRGLHCILCVSYWLSTAAFFWTFETVGILAALIYWHAVAGCVLILQKLLK
jgi:hypothetical protein